MKKISKVISVAISSVMCASGAACSLDREMLEKISTLNSLPNNVNSALERHFQCFKMGMKVKFISTIEPMLVGMKATSSGYEYVEVDISDDESVRKSMGRFDSFIEKNGMNKTKFVFSLKNIDCRDVRTFKEVYKKLSKCDNVMIYVYSPSLVCNDIKCKDCLDLERELKTFSAFERIRFSPDSLVYDGSKDFVRKLVDSWKEMSKKGELDVNVDLDDDDIEIIAHLVPFTNKSCMLNFSSFLQHAFVAANMRSNGGNKTSLCIEDFVRVFMDYCTYAMIDFCTSDKHSYETTAIHEMGHAIVGHLLGRKVLAVALRRNYDGVTVYSDVVAKNWIPNYEDYIIEAKCELAGKLAEKFIMGNDPEGAASDLAAVRESLNSAISIKYPMANLSEKESKVNELYTEIGTEVEKLVLKNAKIIKRMAKCLMDHNEISGMRVVKRSEFIKAFDKITEELKQEAKIRAELLKVIVSKKLTEELVSKVTECLKDAPDDEMYSFINGLSNKGKNSDEKKNEPENSEIDDEKKKLELMPVLN